MPIGCAKKTAEVHWRMGTFINWHIGTLNNY